MDSVDLATLTSELRGGHLGVSFRLGRRVGLEDDISRFRYVLQCFEALGGPESCPACPGVQIGRTQKHTAEVNVVGVSLGITYDFAIFVRHLFVRKDRIFFEKRPKVLRFTLLCILIIFYCDR